MKRTTAKKVNAGPKNPRNRRQKAAKTQAFIAQCEQSLIRLIDQESRQVTEITWLDLEKTLQDRLFLLRRQYPNNKGAVAIAVHNVELALAKLKEEK